MKPLVEGQKELHTLINWLHTLIETIDYKKDNCLVYVVYVDFKQIIIRNAVADLASDMCHLTFNKCHLFHDTRRAIFC